MPTQIVPSHPGVYVEELFNRTLSIHAGTTAVPVFVADEVPEGEVIRIESWLDLISHPLFAQTTPEQQTHRNMLAYFENGGGHGYLVNGASMLESIPALADVTLIVQAASAVALRAINAHCGETKGRFGLIDAPDDLSTWPINDLPQGERAAHAAAYYPRLLKTYAWTEAKTGARQVLLHRRAEDYSVPASVVMAGIFCRTDWERGVWKAPANQLVAGDYRLSQSISDVLQGRYNGGHAVNMLREFPGAGLTIFGARTLADNQWRYIPVRRLFDAAERDIQQAMQFAVFEPNTAHTWMRVKAAIEAYLHPIWKAGGLMGSDPRQGYLVQVGEGLSMTREDVDNGKLIARIGLAVTRPAEFIILQISQDMAMA